MSIGNLQYILLHDIHNLFCGLILKHESTSPEFVWGFQCSLLGSKIHYLGQEKSISLHGSTQVVNIHYLGQIHNLGKNNHKPLASRLPFNLFVSFVASPWLPIVRSQRFENGGQGMKSFNKIE